MLDANQRTLEDSERSPLPVALSLGVALFPSRDVRTKDALLRGADAALHAAKRDGGNRICVFQQQGHIYSPVAGERTADDEAGLVLELAERLRSPEHPAAVGAARATPAADADDRSPLERKRE